MARKQSSGLSKLLNFIGLVDDEDTQDTYGEEYSGDNYGRRATYTPQRQTRTPQSTARPAARSRSLPEQTPRYESRYDSRTERRNTRSYDDYDTARQRSVSRFDDPRYDTRTPRSTARTGSSRQPAPRYDSAPAAVAPQRSMRVSRRSRTVMYSLHSLEDCCEVIDQLIANNTVVLTMDELDGHLLQRAVDTLSGAVFALHASIRKASDRTYLVAPMSVDVSDTYDMDRRF